jgi:hypothetical protein
MVFDHVLKAFLGVGVGLLFLFAIMMIYFGWRYVMLMQKRYPEKARAYGFSAWGNSGFLMASLFRRDDTCDTDINQYKARARNCLIGVVLCMAGLWFGSIAMFVARAYLATP